MYFDEKCSSIFDDEDDDSWLPKDGDENQQPLEGKFEKSQPTLLSNVLKNDFGNFTHSFMDNNNEAEDQNEDEEEGENSRGRISFRLSC